MHLLKAAGPKGPDAPVYPPTTPEQFTAMYDWHVAFQVEGHTFQTANSYSSPCTATGQEVRTQRAHPDSKSSLAEDWVQTGNNELTFYDGSDNTFAGDYGGQQFVYGDHDTGSEPGAFDPLTTMTMVQVWMLEARQGFSQEHMCFGDSVENSGRGEWGMSIDRNDSYCWNNGDDYVTTNWGWDINIAHCMIYEVRPGGHTLWVDHPTSPDFNNTTQAGETYSKYGWYGGSADTRFQSVERSVAWGGIYNGTFNDAERTLIMDAAIGLYGTAQY